MTTQIRETTALSEAASPTEGVGRIQIVLCSPGVGASGFYSKEVLQQAAADRVWPKGTQCHLDHDSALDRENRPEGSVRNLAAVLTEDAHWSEEHGALVAEARVGSTYRNLIADFADTLGTSIVASAEVSTGEVNGQQHRIIERLLPSPFNRVDFVTVAGRGGRIAEVLEAAKPVQEARSIGGWMEARLHQTFTNIADDSYGDGRLSREERITLSGAIGDALTVFVQKLEADAPQLYKRDLWDEPETPVTENKPAQDSVNPTENKETKENTMPEIQESRLRELEEAAGRVTALEQKTSELETENTDLKTKLKLAEAKDYARDFAENLVHSANSELSEAAVQRIVGESLPQIRLTDDGRLDTDHLTTVVAKARETEETYLARIAEESGLGQVRGIGSTEPKTISEADVNATIAGVFGRQIQEA